MADPIHTNPHCRIWHISSVPSFCCPIATSSLYFLIVLNDNIANVKWMPWPIQSHGVDISVDEGEAMYVVELLNVCNSEMKAPSLSTKNNNITTNVGTRLLLENEHVRVWSFNIPAKRKSHMHCHTYNYLFINLTKSVTRGLDRKWRYATPTAVLQDAGQITFVPLQQTAVHAAENVASTEFRQVIVEFKS